MQNKDSIFRFDTYFQLLMTSAGTIQQAQLQYCLAAIPPGIQTTWNGAAFFKRSGRNQSFVFRCHSTSKLDKGSRLLNRSNGDIILQKTHSSAGLPGPGSRVNVTCSLCRFGSAARKDQNAAHLSRSRDGPGKLAFQGVSEGSW